MGRTGASRAGGVLLWASVMWSACAPSGDEIRTASHLGIRLDSASALHVDELGRFWVGGSGEMVVMDPAGSVAFRLEAPAGIATEVVGGMGDVVYIRQGDSLVSVSSASGVRLGARAGFDDVAILHDVRGRFVVQGALSGAVLAYDPRTLEPLWGWPARGAPTTALAAAPEGDVLWQALQPEDGDAVILQRDIQTGRVLATETMSGSVSAMAAAGDGDLLAVMGDGPRVVVMRLRPRSGGLTLVWRAPARPGADGAVGLRHVPGSPAVAIFRPGSDAGLRVLDAEAGDPIGSVGDTPLDAAMSPDGTLYLLYPGEIRRAGTAR